jgi:hypothetical protein
MPLYLLFDVGSGSLKALLGGVLATSLGLTASFWVDAASVAASIVVVWRTLGDRVVGRGTRLGERLLSGPNPSPAR